MNIRTSGLRHFFEISDTSVRAVVLVFVFKISTDVSDADLQCLLRLLRMLYSVLSLIMSPAIVIEDNGNNENVDDTCDTDQKCYVLHLT